MNIDGEVQHYRRVPLHVRMHIEQQLKEDEEFGITDKATGLHLWSLQRLSSPSQKTTTTTKKPQQQQNKKKTLTHTHTLT